MNWVVRFSLISVAGIIGASFIIWALTGFSKFGLDPDDFEFLALGSIFTCLVAVGLMAAIFYSNRSGADDI
jgi:hypothetical protein